MIKSVCAKCGKKWYPSSSPATCPYCNKDSYAITVQSTSTAPELPPPPRATSEVKATLPPSIDSIIARRFLEEKKKQKTKPRKFESNQIVKTAYGDIEIFGVRGSEYYGRYKNGEYAGKFVSVPTKKETAPTRIENMFDRFTADDIDRFLNLFHYSYAKLYMNCYHPQLTDKQIFYRILKRYYVQALTILQSYASPIMGFSTIDLD